MTEEDGPATSRRIYGRGMFDGLRMAGIDNPEGFLNAQKLEKIERGMTGLARKVLDAVPLSEPWDLAQIVSDITRTTGSRPDLQTVKATLVSLVGQGVVEEPRDGRYVRVKVRQPLAPMLVRSSESPPAEPVRVVTAAPAQPVGDVLSRFAIIAGALRLKASELIALAKDLEDAGLSAQAEIENGKNAEPAPEKIAAMLARALVGIKNH